MSKVRKTFDKMKRINYTIENVKTIKDSKKQGPRKANLSSETLNGSADFTGFFKNVTE